MATITSDGRQFIYAVFGADGCECENLEAVFGTEQEAEAYKAELLSGPMWTPLSDKMESANGRFYGLANLLTVECLELGKPRKPVTEEV